MKKKALTLAIAAALSAPASFAATDSDGMQYTRASEGFYGRIATKVESKRTKDGKSDIGFDTARIGVRGTNDMGGGLEGFYQWEANVVAGQGVKWGGTSDPDNNGPSGRLAHWGVRGAFGQVQVGSFWTADYSFVHQADYVGVGEGAAGTYYDDNARQARSLVPSLEYKTPDLNGFQGAVRLSTNRVNGSDSTVGLWNLAAKYEIQGFTVGASYNVVKDGQTLAAYCPGLGNTNTPAITVDACGAGQGDTTVATTEDLKTWSLGLGYAQDNWQVGGWYGTDSYSDGRGAIMQTGANADLRNTPTKLEDSNTLTLGGKVDIGKVGVFANWQRTDNYLGVKGNKRTYGGIGVGYTFTQQTGITGTYRLRDWDDKKNSVNATTGKKNAEQNYFRLVMHHAF